MVAEIETLTGTRMSLQEFRALPETNHIVEYLKGVVVVSPSPTNEHRLKVKRLVRLIERLAPGGEVVTAPMTVYMVGHGVEPDVFWVSDESPCHVEDDGYWYGPPELVCEVLSTNEANDRKVKFEIYEQAVVRKYWLIGTDYIEVFTLQNGRFVRLGAFVADETFHSSTLNAEVPVIEVFED